MCVCVREREKERESESVSVCVCVNQREYTDQYRLSEHRLAIETGRHRKSCLPREQRVCVHERVCVCVCVCDRRDRDRDTLSPSLSPI